MHRSPRLPLVFRTAAIAIAVFGLLDPSCARDVPPPATVAVVVADPGRDSALGRQVIERLEQHHHVVPYALPDADATVFVGTVPPAASNQVSGVIIAIRPASALTQIGPLRAPTRAPPGAHVSIEGALRIVGAVGDTLVVLLREKGQLRDRVAVPITSPDTVISTRVVALPLGEAAAHLAWEAYLADAPGQRLQREQVVTIQPGASMVLLWAPQPSWLPRFVQQALEDDPQIDLVVSTGTADGIRTARGTPPRTLDAPGALTPFPVVLVTSPALLTEREVGALERHARTTGSDIVFLPEEIVGGAWERLVGQPRWRLDSSRVASVRFTDVPDHSLVGTLLAWPTQLPFGALALAWPTEGDAPPVGWQLPLGTGSAVTIGVLDAWRYRARDRSGFQAFWPYFIRGRLAATLPPLRITLGSSVVSPGSTLHLDVSIRAGLLDPAGVISAPEASWSMLGAAAQPLPLVPTGAPGAYRAEWSAQAPGDGRVVVTVGAAVDSLSFSVTPNAPPSYDPAEPLLGAWVTARDGAELSGERLDDLPPLLAARLAPGPRSSRWYPMHSVWWLLPFAIALSAEWWLRRRRGAP